MSLLCLRERNCGPRNAYWHLIWLLCLSEWEIVLYEWGRSPHPIDYWSVCLTRLHSEVTEWVTYNVCSLFNDKIKQIFSWSFLSSRNTLQGLRCYVQNFMHTWTYIQTVFLGLCLWIYIYIYFFFRVSWKFLIVNTFVYVNALNSCIGSERDKSRWVKFNQDWNNQHMSIYNPTAWFCLLFLMLG